MDFKKYFQLGFTLFMDHLARISKDANVEFDIDMEKLTSEERVLISLSKLRFSL